MDKIVVRYPTEKFGVIVEIESSTGHEARFRNKQRLFSEIASIAGNTDHPFGTQNKVKNRIYEGPVIEVENGNGTLEEIKTAEFEPECIQVLERILGVSLNHPSWTTGTSEEFRVYVLSAISDRETLTECSGVPSAPLPRLASLTIYADPQVTEALTAASRRHIMFTIRLGLDRIGTGEARAQVGLGEFEFCMVSEAEGLRVNENQRLESESDSSKLDLGKRDGTVRVEAMGTHPEPFLTFSSDDGVITGRIEGIFGEFSGFRDGADVRAALKVPLDGGFKTTLTVEPAEASVGNTNGGASRQVHQNVTNASDHAVRKVLERLALKGVTNQPDDDGYVEIAAHQISFTRSSGDE